MTESLQVPQKFIFMDGEEFFSAIRKHFSLDDADIDSFFALLTRYLQIHNYRLYMIVFSKEYLDTLHTIVDEHHLKFMMVNESLPTAQAIKNFVSIYNPEVPCRIVTDSEEMMSWAHSQGVIAFSSSDFYTLTTQEKLLP